jgi:hypothetical protein
MDPAVPDNAAGLGIAIPCSGIQPCVSAGL